MTNNVRTMTDNDIANALCDIERMLEEGLEFLGGYESRAYNTITYISTYVRQLIDEIDSPAS